MKFVNPCVVAMEDLFHLSDINHDGEWFIPRVPQNRLHDEDDTQDRVCFAPTIEGAWRAIAGGSEYERIDYRFVHVPGNIKELLKYGAVAFPSKWEVPDVLETGEVWCLDTVEMVCIGMVELRTEFNETTGKLEVDWNMIDDYPPKNVFVDDDGKYRFLTGPYAGELIEYIDSIRDIIIKNDEYDQI